MKLRLRTVFWSLVGIAVIAGAAVSMMPQPVPVEVRQADRGKVQITIDEDGRTRIRDRYVVSSPVAGRSSRITLRPGDPVTQSATVLARIQPAAPTLLDARTVAEARARVAANEASVQRAEVALEEAKSLLDLAEASLGRLQKLVQQGSVAETEVDEARANYLRQMASFRSAKFNQEIAQFELEMAKAALEVTIDESENGSPPFDLVSPITGQVLRVMQESATFVQPGTPLLEIGNPLDLEIEIDVLSSDAVKIQPGQPVILDHWGGERPLNAKIRRVEPAAFTKISALGVEEQRVFVLADFDEPGDVTARLGDGYRVEARIIIWQDDDVVRVPTSALFRHGDDWCVFAIDEQQIARRVVLQVGHRNDQFAEVLSGLEPGDSVIAHPGDKIDEGTRVVPQTEN